MANADWLGWLWLLLGGTLMTVVVSMLAFCIGTAVGLIIVAGRFSQSPAIQGLSESYVTIMRGVPDLLVIYFLFFGGIVTLNGVMKFVNAEATLTPSPFLTGSLAIGLICAAFLSEVFRGAIGSIDRGQIEAARSTGMSGLLLFRRIIMPLALRPAIPGIGNVWLSTLKGSSLVSVTGVAELMRQAQVAAGSTRLPFTFYIIAAALYLGLTAISTWVVKSTERGAQRGIRKIP